MQEDRHKCRFLGPTPKPLHQNIGCGVSPGTYIFNKLHLCLKVCEPATSPLKRRVASRFPHHRL